MIKQVIKPALAAGIGALALITYSNSASAAACTTGQAPQCDSAAAEVLVRLSCTDNGATLNNCFTSTSDLNTWIWGTRHPSATSPLHVRIGAGSFGGLTCSQSGYVTYTGAGVGNSTLSTVTNDRCVNLTYENLTVNAGSSAHQAVKDTAGLTVWKNVEIMSPGYPWFDNYPADANCATIHGKHYFFSSRIVSTDVDTFYGASNAVYNICDEVWFYGTELTSMATIGGLLHTVTVLGGEVYIFGGVIQTLVGSTDLSGTDDSDDMPAAIHASGGAEVNVHGTSIQISSTAAYSPIAAIEALGSSTVVDASGASYQLESASTATRTRIWTDGSATVKAPYLWPNGSSAPSIISQTGADMAVVTSGGTPRFVIYKDGCTSKWYDPHTASCL